LPLSGFLLRWLSRLDLYYKKISKFTKIHNPGSSLKILLFPFQMPMAQGQLSLLNEITGAEVR